MTTSADADQPGFALEQTSRGRVSVSLNGEWTLARKPPSAETLLAQTGSEPGMALSLHGRNLARWDTALLSFVYKLHRLCSEQGCLLDTSALPAGIQRLLSLSESAAPPEQSQEPHHDETLFEVTGEWSLSFWNHLKKLFTFHNQAFMAFANLLRGRAIFRRSEFLKLLQDCGVQALPIVSLVSVLVGLILAFVGAVQLKAFGAQVYIADLVGIAMLREMGAIMTGVIMAGRTGAAFAAQLGTMNVNEEIDALKTLGVSPMEFLVLPRILALMIMMPLLCLYADLMGILGGGIVGVTLFDISINQYLTQTTEAIVLSHLWVGLGKSVVFGLLVAISGCMQGMQSGRSASAVGFAATSSVVMSIVAIIVTDGLFAVICNALGF